MASVFLEILDPIFPGFNEVWETIAVFNEEHREVLEWMISEIHRLKYALREARR